jgi:hypothetical protein
MINDPAEFVLNKFVIDLGYTLVQSKCTHTHTAEQMYTVLSDLSCIQVMGHHLRHSSVISRMRSRDNLTIAA